MSDSKKSKDQQVDGAKVAASILTRMPSSDRERLLSAMRQSSPEVTEKVEQNLVTFEDIAELTPQGVQALIKAIDQRDLALSLTKASEKVSTVIYSNMSDRKKESVKEDAASLSGVELSEVEQAKLRIVKRLEALRTEGKVRTQSEHDVWV